MKSYMQPRCDRPPGMCPYCHRPITECGGNCWQAMESQRGKGRKIYEFSYTDDDEYARFKRFIRRYIEEENISSENTDGTDSNLDANVPVDETNTDAV